MSKANKDSVQKKKKTKTSIIYIPDEHRGKNPQKKKNLSNQVQHYGKRIVYHDLNK